MSGHSKWATIKRKKGAEDAKRGKLFTKVGREIEIAARDGADPDSNFKLRLVVEKARAANMPKDNIERAIRRGGGLEKGAAIEEMTYEGYGPHGVALLVDVYTDNRNRTVADVRRLFTRAGGRLGESGSVAWQFDTKGYLAVLLEEQNPDKLLELAIEAGADDVEVGDTTMEIYTEPENFQWVREFLSGRGVEFDSEEPIYKVPKTWLSLGVRETVQNLNLIEGLEELDDVQQVYSNLDVSDEALAAVEGGD
ncbi:MAG: YebC/PmpR family DNA-binding transcriptional regulator [Chloroflexi bacterium]|nr:YebC/PmpR family DNA-binding transcriptional regulator [Chloroflexota bacterium]